MHISGVAVLGGAGGEQCPGPWQGSAGSCAQPGGSLLAMSGQAAARAVLVHSVWELLRVKEEVDAGAERGKRPGLGCGL